MKYLIPLMTLVLAALASCSGGCKTAPAVHEERRAVYYWKPFPVRQHRHIIPQKIRRWPDVRSHV